MENKETLEEAALKYKNLKLPDDLYDGFISGAKWQSERSYSEEEVFEIVLKARTECYVLSNSETKDWFEQFKKK